MKKLISLLTVLTMVGSIAAAPKKAAKGAKPAAVPTTPVAPATPAAVAPTQATTSSTNFHITLWGGYGIAGKSDFTKYPEEKFITDSQFTTAKVASASNKLGGIAGGLELFYGSSFRFGLGVAFLKGMDNKVVADDSTNGVTAPITTKLDLIPVYFAVKYYLFEGLYLGVGGGLASVSKGSQTIVPTGVIPTASAAYSGSLTTVLGQVGYDLKLSSNFSLGLGADFYYFMGKLPVLFYDANNNPATKDVSGNFLNVVPRLSVTLSF